MDKTDFNSWTVNKNAIKTLWIKAESRHFDHIWIVCDLKSTVVAYKGGTTKTEPFLGKLLFMHSANSIWKDL